MVLYQTGTPKTNLTKFRNECAEFNFGWADPFAFWTVSILNIGSIQNLFSECLYVQFRMNFVYRKTSTRAYSATTGINVQIPQRHNTGGYHNTTYRAPVMVISHSLKTTFFLQNSQNCSIYSCKSFMCLEIIESISSSVDWR